MNKKEIREKYLIIRKSINTNKKQKYNWEILSKIINLAEYKQCKLLLSYVSLKYEVNTLNLIKYSLKANKEVAVPKCEGETITFYYLNSLQDLKKGSFEILEPESKNKVTDFENSICVIPGICFDKSGNRIGYGKGYYDRFLKDYNGLKIGLTYKECICDKIDTDKYDIKMDKVVY